MNKHDQAALIAYGVVLGLFAAWLVIMYYNN